MAHHAPKQLTDIDKAVLGEKAWPWWRNLAILGLGSIIAALLFCFIPGTGGSTRFAFAYLIGFAFALALTLGMLFFLLITTLLKAGWCVAFRRIAENFAANFPTLGVLFIPIAVFVLIGSSPGLYPWANPDVHDPEAAHHAQSQPNVFINFVVADDDHGHEAEGDSHDDTAHAEHGEASGHSDHAKSDDHGHASTALADHGNYTHTGNTWHDHDHAVPYFVNKKGIWLTKPFFIARWVIYFALWSLIGGFYLKKSLKQDQTGDHTLTNDREWWAPLSMMCFAVTLTLAAIDLLVSLDPVWYSTMFGVYFFAGAFTIALSTLVLILMAGQKAGYFPSITTDHYHDLGKLMFAFVFFWGYVGFSQFMLIWYASLPETTYWFEIRGITTVADAPTYGGPWSYVAWLILFGHLLIPFAALLSKHVKRNRKALMVIAIWLIIVCWVDIWWVVMPAFSSPALPLPIPEILATVGCVSITIAFALRLAARHSLTAYNDPRMHESVNLDTTSWAPIHP